MYFDLPEDFYFPEWGTVCKVCMEDIPLEKYRKNELCDECLFDTLTPSAWPEIFLAAIKHWQERH